MINIPFFCINLESRPDRWKKVKREFKNAHVVVNKFNAVSSKTYPYHGCTLSHGAVIWIARDLWYNMVGVFEDDIFFYKPKKFLNEVTEMLSELPKEWRILYFWWLIGREGSFKKKSPYFYQVNNLMSTYGMIYNIKCYDEILSAIPAKNPEEITNIADTMINWYWRYDKWLAWEYQGKYPCFISKRLLVGVTNDYSDIQSKRTNESRNIELRFWLYTHGFWWILRFLGMLGDYLNISTRKRSFKK